VVYRVAAGRPVIALTFDAGSDAGFTSEILRTLRDNNVRATFALTGLWAEQNRDLLLAIAADGHTIMNHSYDHPSFTGRSTGQPPLTPAERALQLARTERTIYRYTSRSTRPYFRPPYGDIDDSVRQDVGAEGYDTIVMWTVDTLGWNGASATDIVARVDDAAEPGAIVIMHVGADSQDALALADVIDNLRGAGYGFVTVDELLALEAE
jgi:peptidoglycan/xylan/chitin deacetylase (PgdA/CDA1 family)